MAVKDDWIKVEKCTARKPEVLRVADILGIHPDHAFGLIIRFWFWVDDQMYSECNAVSVTNVTLDCAIGNAGFTEAMVSAGWLVREVRQDGSVLTIPNFDRHLSKGAKTRAVTARRVQNNRKHVTKMYSKCNAESVTKTLQDRIQDKEKEKELNTPPFIPPEGETRKRFVPPSVEEVAAYCRERGNSIDAEYFIAHYGAKGWKCGKSNTPMTNWKQAVITWEKNREREQRPQPAQQPPANPETVWAALRKNGIDIEAVKRDVGETWCRAVAAVGGWRVLTECSDFNKPKLDARLVQEFERARNGVQA